MSELRTSIAVDLAGNLAARARRFGDAMEGLGARSHRALRGLGRAVEGPLRGLSALGNRYTALAAGYAVGQGARHMMATEKRLEYLGIQGQASAEDMRGLWEEVNRVAVLKDIKADPKEILGAIEKIVEKTGDLKFARENLLNIGRAIQATGAGGDAIGEIISEFQKLRLLKTDAVETAFDTLNAQGKEGAFTLQNLAALGPRVVAAYAASGRGGLQAVREMGAALQMIRMGTGSSEMAATAFEALMRTLQDADKIKVLQGAGIQVFEAGEPGKLRSIDKLMGEIIQKAGGRMDVLSRVFDAEALRAFNAAVGEFKRTGSLGQLDKFMGVNGQGQTAADAERIAQTAAAAWEATSARLAKSSDEVLSKPVKDFSAAVDKFTAGEFTSGLSHLNRGMDFGLTDRLAEKLQGPPRAPATVSEHFTRLAETHGGMDAAQARLRAAMDNGGPFSQSGMPEGRVVVEVKTSGDAEARVRHIEGRGLEVETGPVMRGN